MTIKIRTHAIATADNNSSQDCNVVFKPGAERVRKAYFGTSSTFHNALPYPQNRNDLLDRIAEMPGPLDFFAYFGHGYYNQLGNHILTQDDIKLLANALSQKLAGDASVAFYSCLAGSLGGLTTTLAQNIGTSVVVFGHTSSQHSFKNPDVSSFELLCGWQDLQANLGPSLRAAWVEALQYTDLWLRFPLMGILHIMTECNAIRLNGTWSVPGNSRYTFKLDYHDKVMSMEGDDIYSNPTGEVTDGTYFGAWEMTLNSLEITWGPDDTETWEMPIEPQRQGIQGVSGFAKRLFRGKYGRLQG